MGSWAVMWPGRESADCLKEEGVFSREENTWFTHNYWPHQSEMDNCSPIFLRWFKNVTKCDLSTCHF